MLRETAPFETEFAEARLTRPILEQLSEKWTLMIVSVICSGPVRFNTIKRRLNGITHKTLVDALRRLERSGLIRREVIATAPVAVEYSLTPLALSLREPFLAFHDWSKQYMVDVVNAQERYDGRQTA